MADWHFRQSLQANPTSVESGYNYGAFLTEEGRIDEAIDVYRRVIDTNPHDVLTRTNLVILLKKSGRHEEAERYSRDVDRFN